MPSIRDLIRRLPQILQQEIEEEFKSIELRPDIDHEEFRELFRNSREEIDKKPHIIVTYLLEPADGLTVTDAAGRIAMISTLRTLLPLPCEEKEIRLKKVGKVLDHQDTGQVTIGYPVELIGKGEGLTKLLALITTGVEYIFTKQFWIEQIEFPKSYIERYSGPKYGVEGIRDIFNIQSRPILGLSIEPYLGANLKKITQQCLESLLGGVDCIVDDVLLDDPEGELAFRRRVPLFVKIAQDATNKTGEKKWYIANLGGRISKAVEYAKIAQNEGVGMVKVNTFTMSFSAIEELTDNPDINLPVITTNMGVSLFTRSQKPYSTGISEAVIAKLSRLAGTDGYHLGSIDTGCFIQEFSHPAIIALQSKLYEIKPTMIVIQGDITIANAWQNISVFGPNIIMESCNGILGYPGGARNGAQALRKLVDAVPYSMTPVEAHEKIIELGLQDKSFGQGLNYYGYNSQLIDDL